MLSRYVLPSVAFVIAFAILCGLGFWQVQRLAWKQALIARVEARFGLDPVPLPPGEVWSEPDFIDRFEYRPVALTGAFVPVPESDGRFERFYVYTLLSEPRGPRGGQGYWVMNLFQPDGGGLVYVNRGFIEFNAREREAPPPEGQVTLTGVVRDSSTGSSFTPPCEHATTTCYVANTEFAARMIGEADVAPFYIDMRADGIAGAPAGVETAGADPTALVPQGGETRIAFTNSHLQYAVTWFGLAASLLGVFAVFMAGRFRGRSA